MRNMPPASFDPLSNPKTSEVLFLLMQRIDTPTGLARKLRISPPSVMEHLNRLRKIRVIVPGEKTGKDQHYQINWHHLTAESVYRTIAPKFAPNVHKIEHDEEFVNSTHGGLVLFLEAFFKAVLSDNEMRSSFSTYSDWVMALFTTLVDHTEIFALDSLHAAKPAKPIVEPYMPVEEAVASVPSAIQAWIRRSQAPTDINIVNSIHTTLENLGLESDE
jgi:DNA-binding transcriptional ArsR family regulator